MKDFLLNFCMLFFGTTFIILEMSGVVALWFYQHYLWALFAAIFISSFNWACVTSYMEF